MKTDPEQPEQIEKLVEELVQRAKANNSLFGLPKDPSTQQTFKIIQDLNNIPRAEIPMANF